MNREELVECHVCHAVIPKSEAFRCGDCNEWTCDKSLCGDGAYCNMCLLDDVLMLDLLDLEEGF